MTNSNDEQPEINDPAPSFRIISESGAAIERAYEQYKALRLLIQQLNGLSDSAPLPTSLRIDRITIDYTIADNTPSRAAVHGVRRVGDLSSLIAGEVDRLVNTIRAEAERARAAADFVADTCSAAQYRANAQQSSVTP
jgi:hypothetical protein